MQSGGETFLRYLKGVEYTGLTGEILFDDNGHRTDFKLDLIEKKRDNMIKTGTWYPESGVNYTVTVEEGEAMVVKQLQNMTLRVVTVQVSIIFDPLCKYNEFMNLPSFRILPSPSKRLWMFPKKP